VLLACNSVQDATAGVATMALPAMTNPQLTASIDASSVRIPLSPPLESIIYVCLGGHMGQGGPENFSPQFPPQRAQGWGSSPSCQFFGSRVCSRKDELPFGAARSAALQELLRSSTLSSAPPLQILNESVQLMQKTRVADCILDVLRVPWRARSLSVLPAKPGIDE